MGHLMIKFGSQKNINNMFEEEYFFPPKSHLGNSWMKLGELTPGREI